MISILIAWAIRFSLFLFFVLLATAIMSYFSYRAPKHHELYNLRPEELLGAWHELAAGLSNQLYSLGFVRTGFIAAGQPSRINIEILIHAQLPVSAGVILMVAGEQRIAYVELKTRFDDGHMVSTTNSRTPALFTYPENMELHRSTADWVRELLNEHLASVHAAGAGRVPLAAPQIETAASTMADEEVVMAHQVACGLFRDSGDGETLRYTVGGALRCTFGVWRRFSFLRPQAPPQQSPSTVPRSRAA